MQNFCGTKTIHEKMTQVNILRLYMSSLRNKVDCTDQIEKKQHIFTVKQDLPTTVKEITELLKVATNNLSLSMQLESFTGTIYAGNGPTLRKTTIY